MVQYQLQALLDIKVEPKEALEEVKKEEGLYDASNLGMALEEEKDQRKWSIEERERKMVLDYYVNMASNTGSVPKNKRERKTEDGDYGMTRVRKPRKWRKARAPRNPRDRHGKD